MWLVRLGAVLSGVVGVADLRPHSFPLPLQALAKSDDEAYDRAAEEAAMKKNEIPLNIILLKHGFLDR